MNKTVLPIGLNLAGQIIGSDTHGIGIFRPWSRAFVQPAVRYLDLYVRLSYIQLEDIKS